jgi:hypothetical protein
MVAKPSWMKNPFRKQSGQPSNVININASGGVMPVSGSGKKLAPHEFLEAQIINLPDEEESLQKRLLLSAIYFIATWGGSIIMVLLGIGLASDLSSVFKVPGAYAFALTLLFPFGELLFEALAILVGERLQQGIKTQGDALFTIIFGLFVLVANCGTAALQIYLMTLGMGTLSTFAQIVLWFRAFLPLATVIATIGVVAGIQRRSLSRMIRALERKTDAINKVAKAAVGYMESEVTVRRLVDEHQELRDMRAQKDEAAQSFMEMMKQALEDKMKRLQELEDRDRNGNGRGGRY